MSFSILEVALAATSVCNKCGKEKSLARDFYADKRSRTGRMHQCKECHKMRSRERAQRIQADPITRAKRREQGNAWDRAHKEWRREYDQRYQSPRDPEHVRQYQAQWRADNAASVRAYDGLRRARKFGATYEPVSYDVLFEKAAGICQEEHCLLPVDPNLAYIDPETGRPNPGYGTVGHIIDLSAGGDHTYANTRLEHLSCNRERPRTPRGEREQEIAAIFRSNHGASVQAFWTHFPETGT